MKSRQNKTTSNHKANKHLRRKLYTKKLTKSQKNTEIEDDILLSKEQSEAQENEDEQQQENQDQVQIEQIRQPAWVDQYDQQVEIDLEQKNRTRKLIKKDKKIVNLQEYQSELENFKKSMHSQQYLSWTQKKQSTNEITDLKQMLLSNLSNDQSKQEINVEKTGFVLPKDKINSVVQSIDFHSNSNIFAAGGYDKLLKIYKVNQQANKLADKIQCQDSFHLKNFPIHKCKFIDNSNVLCQSQKQYIINCDINKAQFTKINLQNFNREDSKVKVNDFSFNHQFIAVGKNDGSISIVDNRSQVYLYDLYAPSPITSCAFNSNQLIHSCQNNYIYIWDLRNQKISQSFINHGANHTNSIQVSDNKLFCGSENGIVNVYDLNDMTLLKEIQNLSTSISGIVSNEESGKTVIFSKWAKNGLRIIKNEDLSIVKSFPSPKDKIQGYATAVALSLNQFAIGNSEGQINLYQYQ